MFITQFLTIILLLIIVSFGVTAAKHLISSLPNSCEASVWRSLHEDVDPRMVRQALIDVLADYEDARILTFVPILACRGAEEKLKRKE
jgi:hypothetical protein